MDWRLLAATFGTVFLAELGDKTQLATLCFAASGRSFWSVFLGSSLALVLTSLVAALSGSGLARIVPVRYVSIASGVLFIVIGVFVIIRNVR
ncbi:MAG: TMEM165/GDT1 family protein [candidate division WOR-3 bacterium]